MALVALRTASSAFRLVPRRSLTPAALRGSPGSPGRLQTSFRVNFHPVRSSAEGTEHIRALIGVTSCAISPRPALRSKT